MRAGIAGLGRVQWQWNMQDSHNFREWRQGAYRRATLVWCLLLLCAYTMTLLRMPMGFSPQVCLLSSLHLLTSVVLASALKGSNKCLRISTTVLMVVRSFGYAGIGLGLVPLEFKAQFFASHDSKARIPLSTFSSLAALLFDSVGLVHALAPRLQLCLQIVTGTICNMSSGNTLLSSLLRALVLHGLCGSISAMLQWRDLQCYTAMQERQRKASGDQLMAKEAKQAGIGCKAHVEMPEQEEGGSQGVQANEEARCLEDARQAFGPAPAHAAAQGLVAGAGLLDSQLISSLDTRMDSLHDALQMRMSGPEGRARLERVQRMSVCLHGKCTYGARASQRHKVVVKVPGAIHPRDLPKTAIPDLCCKLHAKCASITVRGAAVRSGCVLVCLSLGTEQHGTEERQDRESTKQAVVDVVQGWLHDTQLAAQLPASMSVQLQVEDKVWGMALDASTQEWTVEPLACSQCIAREACSIRTTLPAALLPPNPQSKQQQHQQQGLQGGSSQPGGSTMTLHASVRWPVGIQLCGWKGDAAALASPASVKADGGAEQQQGASGKEEGVQEMQVLASVDGYRYLPTAVELEPTAVSTNTDLKAAVVKVHVSLPAGVVSSNCPFLLGLELWHQSTLLGSSSMALLPASMPEAATELQGLPWGTADAEDVADFIMDLGQWLSSNRASSPLSSSSAVANQQQRTPWEVGVSLLQQSVLWGLPTVSTLLVDSLMAMPSAPVNPFSQLAHVPARGAEPALRSPEDGDIPMRDIGGLLHLSLLCPNSRDMLAAVLDWGERWGSREPGFSWRWSEEGGYGLSPLDILASLPRESQVLRLLLQDPVHGRVLLTAALQRARAKEQAGSLGSQDGEGSHSPLPPVSAPPLPVSVPVAGPTDVPPPSALISTPLPIPSACAAAPVPGSGDSAPRPCSSGGSAGNDAGSGREVGFRSWANAQALPLALRWCVCAATMMGAALLRELALRGPAACLSELRIIHPYLVAYSTGALMLRIMPQRSEVVLSAIICCRLYMTLSFGAGWRAITTIPNHVYSIRLDAAAEVCLMSVLEQVRLAWLLPLRVMMVIGQGLLLKRLGKPYAWAEAVLQHVCCAVVCTAMDWRLRSLYARRLQRIASHARKDARVGAAGVQRDVGKHVAL